QTNLPAKEPVFGKNPYTYECWETHPTSKKWGFGYNDDCREAVGAANGSDDFHVGGVAGRIHPRIDVVGEKVRFLVGVNDLRVSEIKEGEGAFSGADIHRLPKPVQYEDRVV
ncbi:MAG: hypothetical protein AAF585_16800, partial [Verrucomicrobiota bacterium]